MRAFIFTSKALLLAPVFLCLALNTGWAATGFGGAGGGASTDDDFAPNPYMDYAEFNNDREEEAETRFFQHGRFFGMSVGMGMQAADGNRGILWQGGFPTFDFKLHYWFDFNVALDLGFYTAPHHFKTNANNMGSTNANLTWVGVNLKYYFDTKNLAAPISFANPYVLLGGGGYTKTETSLLQNSADPDTSVGLSMGAAIEFPIKHRSLYFTLEGKVHFVNFSDTHIDIYQPASITPTLKDLTGRFYTFVGSFLFTW